MNCTLLGFEIGMAAHAFQHSHDPLFAILLRDPAWRSRGRRLHHFDSQVIGIAFRIPDVSDEAEIKAAIARMTREIWLAGQVLKLTYQPRDPKLAYYQMIVARGGGIITLGDFLGVFVAATELAARTPAGWLFVPIEGLTAEMLKDRVDEVRDGRKGWPPKEIPVKPDKPKLDKR